MPQLRLERGSLIYQGEAAPAGLVSLDEPSVVSNKLKPGPGRSREAVGRHQRARVQAAMIEIVAAQGYQALTVREIARRAGVSTRAFYSNYSGKEECFLLVQHLISSRFRQRLEANGAAQGRSGEPVASAIGEILGEWDRDPAAARLMLVEVPAFGAPALADARRTRHAIECLLSKALSRVFGEVFLVQRLVTGVAAGVAGVARRHLLDEPGQPLTGLVAPLTRWVLAHRDCSPELLGRLDDSQASHSFSQPGPSSSGAEEGSRALDGELALLLSAAARLGASEGSARITPAKIALAAGLPRRRFDERFVCVDDCLEALLRSYAEEVVNEARPADAGSDVRAGAVCCLVARLCDLLARDHAFASLCFDEAVAPGQWRFRCHQHLIDELRAAVQGATTAGDSRLTSEASAVALCAIFQDEVTRGHAACLPGLAPALAYMLLAPTVGGAQALAVVRDEQGRAM